MLARAIGPIRLLMWFFATAVFIVAILHLLRMWNLAQINLTGTHDQEAGAYEIYGCSRAFAEDVQHARKFHERFTSTIVNLDGTSES